MKLNVLERVMALGCLPEAGDFATLITVKEAREALALKEEEVTEFEYKTVAIADGKSNMTWNTKGNEEREIELSKTAIRMIEDKLKELDKDKKLIENQLSLYKKIITE